MDEDRIENAAGLALGDLATWQRPNTLPGVGPQNPNAFCNFDKRLRTIKAEIVRVLRQLPEGEFKRGYSGDEALSSSPINDEHGIHHKLAAEIRALHDTCPPWFAAGWVVQGRTVDRRHWTAATVVSLAEASLLTVGVDPRFVEFSNLFEAFGRGPDSDNVLYFLDDRFEEIARGLAIPPKEDTPVQVDQLVAWIVEHDVQVSWEFREAFKHPFRANKHKSRETGGRMAKELHPSTEAMLQRVIATMAVNHYKMKSEDDAKTVAKRIKQEGELLAFYFTDRLLPNILKAGFKQINQEAKDVLREDL